MSILIFCGAPRAPPEAPGQLLQFSCFEFVESCAEKRQRSGADVGSLGRQGFGHDTDAAACVRRRARCIPGGARGRVGGGGAGAVGDGADPKGRRGEEIRKVPPALAELFTSAQQVKSPQYTSCMHGM